MDIEPREMYSTGVAILLFKPQRTVAVAKLVWAFIFGLAPLGQEEHVQNECVTLGSLPEFLELFFFWFGPFSGTSKKFAIFLTHQLRK